VSAMATDEAVRFDCGSFGASFVASFRGRSSVLRINGSIL
jgi:hypothetical protein